MKVIITITFCCDNVRKSKFVVLKKPGNSGNCFSDFVDDKLFSNTVRQSKQVLHTVLLPPFTASQTFDTAPTH